jgi:hypothetical protein
MDRVRPPDGRRAGLGQPDVADLARGHQLAEGSDRFLDGCARVHPVLVVQVDAIGAEPSQRPVDRRPDVGGCAVHAGPAGVRDEAELGGQNDVVPAALDRAPDQFLVDIGPVHLGGVQMCDAQIQGATDGTDRLALVAAGAGVVRRHPHGAEADTRYLESAQTGGLHVWSLFSIGSPG